MKKQIIFAVILVLFCNLAVAGYAAQDSLVIEDVCAGSGEMVYLKLRLNDTIRGDAIGVTFTYDRQYLELVEEECTWAKQGILQDFDGRKNAGVWADSKATDFTGEICTLAFRVITGEAYFDTVVNCTLIVKNGANEAGTVSADARIYCTCEHSFGAWTDTEKGTHLRACQKCGFEESEPHSWRDRETTVDPENPDVAITVYYCAHCAAKESLEHSADVLPNTPDATKPTSPEHNPTKPAEPTKPTDNPKDTQPTSPGNNSSGQEDDHTGHNHGAPVASAEWFGVLATVGIIAILIGAAVWFVKKKR